MRARLGILALIVACSPYDPSLGSTPFLCGSAAPPCPDGFNCVDQGAAMVCESPAAPAGSGSGSGSGFSCAPNGTLGSNNSVATAYQTPVDSLRSSITYGVLSICPTGDQAFFAVDIVTTLPTLTATLAFTPLGDPLQLLLLNSAGAPVAMGSGTGVTLTASVANEPTGTVYVEVTGPATPGSAMGENNYDLNISVQ
jgi:hypothetical protein